MCRCVLAAGYFITFIHLICFCGKSKNQDPWLFNSCVLQLSWKSRHMFGGAGFAEEMLTHGRVFQSWWWSTFPKCFPVWVIFQPLNVHHSQSSLNCPGQLGDVQHIQDVETKICWTDWDYHDVRWQTESINKSSFSVNSSDFSGELQASALPCFQGSIWLTRTA